MGYKAHLFRGFQPLGDLLSIIFVLGRNEARMDALTCLRVKVLGAWICHECPTTELTLPTVPPQHWQLHLQAALRICFLRKYLPWDLLLPSIVGCAFYPSREPITSARIL